MTDRLMTHDSVGLRVLAVVCSTAIGSSSFFSANLTNPFAGDGSSFFPLRCQKRPSVLTVARSLIQAGVGASSPPFQILTVLSQTERLLKERGRDGRATWLM